jgi:hypothetical protein
LLAFSQKFPLFNNLLLFPNDLLTNFAKVGLYELLKEKLGRI